MAMHTLNDQSPADSTYSGEIWLACTLSDRHNLCPNSPQSSPFGENRSPFSKPWICETFCLVCNVGCFFFIIIISGYFLWISGEAAVKGWTWTVGMFRWVWQMKNECMNTRSQNWRLTLTGSILSIILTQFPALVWCCHSDILILPTGY